MKFVVRIDNKLWEKHARRLEKQGIVGPPAEILETILSTSLMHDPNAAPKHVGDTTITSTSVMLILGRIKVEQVPDDPPPHRADPLPHRT